MQITVNDKKQEIAEGATVLQLIQELNITAPLAVELNRKVCPRKNHAQTQLKPGDILEIVTIVGGG